MKGFLFLLPALLLLSCAETKFPISFHMEASEGQSRKFTIPHNGVLYDKVPFISEKGMQSYRSFRAADGTFGVVLNVKPGLSPRIEAYTSNNLGKNILPIVYGRPMELQHLYNKPISNGALVLWSGFSPADLAQLSEVVPPTKEEEKKNIKSYAEKTIPLLSAKPKEEKPETERKVLSEKRGRF
ncbi:MAG: hypothetical protein RR719_00495 [Akkermansia sp.]